VSADPKSQNSTTGLSLGEIDRIITDLSATADFLDWLCDRGYVVAQRSIQREWIPISEETASRLARSFLEERLQVTRIADHD